MTARRSPEEQAALDAAITELHENHIVFHHVLGLRIESLAPPALRFEMRPELVGHPLYGRLHGGVTASTLDAVGGLALLVALGNKHPEESAAQVMHRFARMGTIDLRIDYLRPGLGRHFVASAEVTRLGSRVGSVQMRLVNDQGALLATGAGVYVLS